MNMLNQQTTLNLVYLFAILVATYYLFWKSGRVREMFSGLVVENAFSDTRCVDDALPLVKFHPRPDGQVFAPHTFRCLSIDGKNCITRDSLKVPKLGKNSRGRYDGYHCTNTMVEGQSVRNVNFYLSRDGLVQTNPQRSHYLAGRPVSETAKAFFDFDYLTQQDDFFDGSRVKVQKNKNIKYLTCTPDGLKNPNHWCGQIWNNISPQCSTERGKFGEYQAICKNVPVYMAGTNVGSDVTEMSYLDIANKQTLAKAEMQRVAKEKMAKKP